MTNKFEWDSAKNALNLKKHGISFEEASKIFNGPILTKLDERGYSNEIRELSFGLISGIVVIALAHTERNGTIRIISARRATKMERKIFYAYLNKTFG